MSKSKVLVVEDDSFLSKILINRLQEENLEVEHAEDGAQALTKMKAATFGLILLDLLMPAMTGFDVLKNMKEMGDSTPVLVFTNLSQPEDKQEAIKLGALACYVKSDMAIDDVVGHVKEVVTT